MLRDLSVGEKEKRDQSGGCRSTQVRDDGALDPVAAPEVVRSKESGYFEGRNNKINCWLEQ